MAGFASPAFNPAELCRLLGHHWRLWAVPAAVTVLIAAGYAVMRPDTWEASQALIVRNEAANQVEGPGKFRHADEMKTIQETILEIAKSAPVLKDTLIAVGPPAAWRPAKAWPSPKDIEAFAREIRMTPPGGAEFGKTEVFYLKVRDRDAQRAVSLAKALCGKLQARFQRLLDDRARSMIAELTDRANVARTDLESSTQRLAQLEQSVGGDLAELRMLHHSSSADSDLRRKVTEIDNELRQVSATQRANEELLGLLHEAREDAGRLLATPNRLLESQPALRRLKDGLVDAQLRTAQLQGAMSDDHPQVRAAKASEREISGQIHDELAIAIRGVEVELQLNQDRTAELDEQLQGVRTRLERLAALRASYSNLVAEAANRGGLVEQSEKNLSEARASHASSRTALLIDRIDEPTTGTRPLGPGRAMTVLFGLAGGLAIGAGVFFLMAPSAPGLQAGDSTAAAAEQSTNSATRRSQSPRSVHPAGLSLKHALVKLATAEPSVN